MIVGSLLLIVVSMGLLGLGLVQGSNTQLVGSIAVSLLAAITLVVGSRYAARSRDIDGADSTADDSMAGVSADVGVSTAANAELDAIAVHADADADDHGGGDDADNLGGGDDADNLGGGDDADRDDTGDAAGDLADDRDTPRAPGIVPEIEVSHRRVPEAGEPMIPVQSAAADVDRLREVGVPTEGAPDPAGVGVHRGSHSQPDSGTGDEFSHQVSGGFSDGFGSQVSGDVGGDVGVEDPPDEPAAQQVSAADTARVAQLDAEVVVIDGRPRYHLAHCAHLDQRDHEPLPVAEAVELGFTPCGRCEPDRALLAEPGRV